MRCDDVADCACRVVVDVVADEDKKEAVARAYEESAHAREELETSLLRAEETISQLRKKKEALYKQIGGAREAKSAGSARAFPSALQSTPTTPPAGRVAAAASAAAAARTPAPFASPHTPLRRTPQAAANISISPEQLQLQVAMSSLMSNMVTDAFSAARSLPFAQGAPMQMEHSFTPGTVRSGSRARSSRGADSHQEGRPTKRQPTPEGFAYTGAPAAGDRRRVFKCLRCEEIVRSENDRITKHRQSRKCPIRAAELAAKRAASRGDPHAQLSCD